MLLGAFLVAYLYIGLAVIRPIKQLTIDAEQLSTGENVDLGLEGVESSTRNEVQQLMLAVDRLRTSLQIAIQRMKKRTS